MLVPQINLLEDVCISGFHFAGLSCGIKDDAGKKDLAVIFSSSDKTIAAGVFTLNKICAAPVRLCQTVLKTNQGRAIIVNSGVANAATGRLGMQDAKSVQAAAAKALNISSRSVFVCSTGKIGLRLPLDKIFNGLSSVKKNLNEKGFAGAAQAIMTTDAYPKTFSLAGKIGNKNYQLAVMAKGAGMIAPNMATMLCFILTDIVMEKKALQQALREAVDDTLNALTVDGDTSTNDTVLMLSSQMAENRPIKSGSADYKSFVKNLRSLLEQVTLAIALDGEGATKCLLVNVSGAKNNSDAKKAAHAIGNSNLSKTAVAGCDPNWGRFLCAAGYSGAQIVEEKTKIRLGGIKIFEKGRLFPENENAAAHYLRENKIVELSLDLGLGKGGARCFASDLTCDYVKFNADYRT